MGFRSVLTFLTHCNNHNNNSDPKGLKAAAKEKEADKKKKVKKAGAGMDNLDDLLNAGLKGKKKK